MMKAIKHYLFGMLASAWNGAISSVAAIVGIDAVAFTGADVSKVSDLGAQTTAHVLNWHEMVAAFLGAFVIHAIMWMKAHPIPEQYEDTAPPIPTK